MSGLRITALVLGAALAAPWASGTVAQAKGGGHGKPTTHSTAAPATQCVAGASTATFTDRFGTGTVAFRNRGACIRFAARNRSLTAFTVTATASFSPQTALPATVNTLRVTGNSVAARAVCPTTHNSTVVFTNTGLTVNGQPVKISGQTVTVNQLSTSAATVLAGTHTFTNHGGCVSFFAINRNLFILTLK